MCCTPFSWSWTDELSPPYLAWPQVTTALSPWHHKANAPSVATSCGWSIRAVRHSPSSISASSKVCSKLSKTLFSAVTSLRYFFPKALWASVITSWTVEQGWSVRSSGFPFSKATLIWSICDVLKIWTTLQNISNESLLGALSPSQARIHDQGYLGTMRATLFRQSTWMMTPCYVTFGWVSKMQAPSWLPLQYSVYNWLHGLIFWCAWGNTTTVTLPTFHRTSKNGNWKPFTSIWLGTFTLV